MPHPSSIERRRPRRSARVLASALLSLSLGAGLAVSPDGGPTGGGSAAGAVEPGGGVRAETTGAPPSAELIVAPVEPVLRDGAAEFEFDVLIRNRGEEPLRSGAIDLELSPQRIETAEDLQDDFPISGQHLADARIGETAAESEQVATLTVPREDLPLLDRGDPGVYQLRATFVPGDETPAPTPDPADADTGGGADDAAGALSATAPIVWRGAGDAEVPLSVIVPLVLPSDIRTLPTRGQLEEVVPRLDRLLTAAGAQRATLAIDPRVIAGIRAYGEEAPEDARRFLNRLEASALPSFLLQFADADPAAQAALGFEELLSPVNLDFVTRFGSFPSEDTTGTGAEGDGPTGDSGNAEDPGGSGAGSSAAGEGGSEATGNTADTEETPAPGEGDDETGPPPGLRELLSWPGRDSAAWPAEGAVDQGTLGLLQANGIDSFVLDSENVAQEGGPRVTLEQGSALITDAAVGAAARAALAEGTETGRALGVAELAAQLALAAQNDSPGLILGLDRAAVADAEDPAALLEQLAALDGVSPTLASEQAAGTASLRSAGTLEERRELLRSAANREQTINEIGAVLVRPEYLSGYQRARLLELFATRYADPDADFAEVAGAFRKRDAELLSGVHAISTDHTQLVGTSSRVPVQLYNSLPFDALVSVQVVPSSAALTVSERRFADVVVPGEGNERVLVPVRSRVSSGESGLVVSIADRTGDLTVYTGTISISIRSSVEAIAIWTLGVLAALLLGFGTWRSVRRRARSSEATAGSDAEALEGTPE